MKHLLGQYPYQAVAAKPPTIQPVHRSDEFGKQAKSPLDFTSDKNQIDIFAVI